jgi:glycerol-3-phosphate dehydrogenase
MAGRKLDKRSKVCVGLVGLGNLGTAIGNLAANNGYEVIGWEYYGSVVDEINSEHTNTRFLSGFELNRRLAGTRDLEEVPERGAKAETFSYLAGFGGSADHIAQPAQP